MLLAVSQAQGVQCDCIPRIATGFGGGMGRQGEVCGAVSGGVMALGLVYGRQEAGDKQTKELAYAKTADFVNRFTKINGDLRCRDLLNVDIGSEEGLQTYRDLHLKGDVCTGAVGSAVRILLSLMEQVG